MNKDRQIKKIAEYLMVVLLAVVMSLNYEILIFPNSFAPAGINGVATIIQHIFGFSVGYMSIIINIPLLILAFIFVDKEYTFKTALYVAVFSVAVLILQNGDTDIEGVINVKNFVYKNGVTSKIIAPIASGAISGFIYGMCFRRNGCTGGTDIIAKLVRIKKPYLNFFWVLFVLNSSVAILSYFAYAEGGVYNLEPVILCLLYSFISSETGDIILKGNKSALKFEVVTSHPEEISNEIIDRLNHTATVVKAQGMFTHLDKSLLICVVSRNQVIEFENIVKKYPETFTYLSSVNEIVGNFVRSENKK